jgi:CRISPR-associated protein Csx17
LLASEKDGQELVEFFLQRYAPAAIVSPWNKGSGFFYADDPGLASLETSTAARFEPLRQGIRAAREKLNAMVQADQRVRAIKAESKSPSLSKSQRDLLRQSEDYKKRLAEAERNFKNLKANLFSILRRDWRASHRRWMDAALVLDEEGEASFPALLGTGGNDGRLDFTNNYYQRLGALFDLSDPQGRAHPHSDAALREALFGEPARSQSTGIAVGQFAPGGAGGANASIGVDGASRLNPWDFVLMLEGAILFTAASTRRLNTQSGARAAAPFAVGSQGAGYASAAAGDEGARGEQWMPLWSQPMTCAELQRLLAEGRAQLNAKAVTEPLDLARAVARLGVARGITAFERYGYIERNGQSNLAVPLGRFVVPDQATPALACLDDLDVWLGRLRREARGREALSRLILAERCLADALFALTQHPDETPRWQLILERLADIEAIQIHGAGIKAGPIPRLRAQWLEVADDGSAEFRLAAAFALQCGDADRPSHDGVRRHWLTLSKGRFKTSGTGGTPRLAPDTDRVMQGRDGGTDALAVLSRRLIEAAQHGERRLPLEPGFGVAASRHDLARLLAGEVDVDRCLRLARALMAVDRNDLASHRPRLTAAAPADWPDDAWLTIRLALLPWPLPDGRHAGVDPAIVRRLEAGDAASAVAIAVRRLRAADIPCAVRVAAAAPELARRYAVALAFPISRRTAAQFAQRLSPFANQEYAA